MFRGIFEMFCSYNKNYIDTKYQRKLEITVKKERKRERIPIELNYIRMIQIEFYDICVYFTYTQYEWKNEIKRFC